MLDALVAIVAVSSTLLLVAALASIVGSALTPEPAHVVSLEELVESVRGLRGWELVAEAQRRVHHAMPAYGLWSGFDTPRMALSRGRGLCWHRALVLRHVLAAHGISCELVHAFRNRFEDGLVSGHAWLVVTLDGERRWVCADRAENAPAVVGFTPLGPVRPFGAAMIALSWLGGPIVNVLFWASGRMAHGPRTPLATLAKRFIAHPGAVVVWVVVLAWNLALAPRLPAVFEDDASVPWIVSWLELAGRGVLGAGAVFLATGARTPVERRGRALALGGLGIYLASWAPALVVTIPSASWCLPYLTPILWLIGLALWARSGGYLVASVLFALAHALHGIVVLGRLVA